MSSKSNIILFVRWRVTIHTVCVCNYLLVMMWCAIGYNMALNQTENNQDNFINFGFLCQVRTKGPHMKNSSNWYIAQAYRQKSSQINSLHLDETRERHLGGGGSVSDFTFLCPHRNSRLFPYFSPYLGSAFLSSTLILKDSSSKRGMRNNFFSIFCYCRNIFVIFCSVLNWMELLFHSIPSQYCIIGSFSQSPILQII